MVEIPNNLCNYELLNQQIANLTKSMEIEQNFTQLRYQGKIYFVMGEYRQALADFTKLLESEPNDPFALRYRVEIYYLMQEFEASLVDLDKLIEINTNNDKWVYETYEVIIRK